MLRSAITSLRLADRELMMLPDPKNKVLISMGNPEMRHGYLVEFGIVKAEAQPFMRPGFQLAKPRVMARLSRAITKVIKVAGGAK